MTLFTAYDVAVVLVASLVICLLCGPLRRLSIYLRSAIAVFYIVIMVILFDLSRRRFV